MLRSIPRSLLLASLLVVFAAPSAAHSQEIEELHLTLAEFARLDEARQCQVILTLHRRVQANLRSRDPADSEYAAIGRLYANLVEFLYFAPDPDGGDPPGLASFLSLVRQAARDDARRFERTLDLSERSLRNAGNLLLTGEDRRSCRGTTGGRWHSSAFRTRRTILPPATRLECLPPGLAAHCRGTGR
jgi:hypothetical protein